MQEVTGSTPVFSTNTGQHAFIAVLAKYLAKKKTYTDPEVYHGNYDPSVTWRIEWYEEITEGNWKRARPTANLNRIADVNDRIRAATMLCDLISDALDHGWRYYAPEDKAPYTNLNCIDCLIEHAKSKASGLSTLKSGRSFISWVKLFTEFMQKKKWGHLNVNELTPLHVQLYIDSMIQAGKSNVTINNSMRALGNVFGRIKRIHQLRVNPFKEVDKLPETESMRFETYTDEELTRINDHLKQVCPQLRLFFLHVYYGFMRPASIVRLQRMHYDFDSNTITINPESHKNRRATKKQILGPLREALQAAGVPGMDQDTYIFSTALKPGNTLRTTSTPGRLWKQHVIDELGINKKLYAAKHTGATNYLLDNNGQENIRWFQNQMGHWSLAESQAYIDKKKNPSLDEQKARIRKL